MKLVVRRKLSEAVTDKGEKREHQQPRNMRHDQF